MAQSGKDLSPAEVQALLAGPAAPPPAGTVPTFAHSAPPGATVGIVLLTLVPTLFVAMRLYTRRVLIRHLAVEDYLILIAWMLLLVQAAASIMTQKHGLGHHMWRIQLGEFLKMLYWVNISAVTYLILVALIKIALLLQILRIFAPDRHFNRRLYVSSWACLVLMGIVYTTLAICAIAQCVPREKIWNPFLKGGHCLNEVDMFKVPGVFNIVTDFIIVLLPLPDLYRLHVNPRKKMMFTSVFVAGILTCVTSILRTYYTWRSYETNDVSWYMYVLGGWTWGEMVGGIIIFCLPVLPRFVTSFRKQVTCTGPDSRHVIEEVQGHKDTPRPKGLFTQMLDLVSLDEDEEEDEYSQKGLSSKPSQAVSTQHDSVMEDIEMVKDPKHYNR